MKGTVNRKGNKIYHVKGWRDHAKVRLNAEEGDKCFRSVLDAELFLEFEKATITLSTDELVTRMDSAGVPCAKVNTFDEVLNDPRVTHRESIIEYDHPHAGRLRQARPAAIFAGEPNGVRRPSPTLGQHTDELLASVGCSDVDIAALRVAGAID